MKTSPSILLLNKAYASELETVRNYLAYLVWLDRIHAQKIFDAVAENIPHELGHAKKLAGRLAQLGVCPQGSEVLPRRLGALQLAADRNGLQRLVANILTTERIAIAVYREIVAACHGTDPVTASLATRILVDEEAHRGRFMEFLKNMDKALAA